MIYDQLMALCSQRGEKPTPLLKEIGVSPSYLYRWKKGSPVNSDVLFRLSQHFGVPTDYFFESEPIEYLPPNEDNANKTCEKAMSEASERINSINDELIHKISSKHLSISQDEREERIRCIGRIVAEAYKDNNIDVFDSFSYPDFVVFLYSLYSHFSDYIKEYTAERHET